MEKNMKKNIYTYTHTYMYNWVNLLYRRNEHILNQLYLNKFLKSKNF